MAFPRRTLLSGGSAWAGSVWGASPVQPIRCCRHFAVSAVQRRSDSATTATESPSEAPVSSSSDTFSASVSTSSTAERPRWAYTPERMKAPFSLHPKDASRPIWKVNEDPVKLDRMYEKILGRDLVRSLPEDLKWLAVTHKSFDNGRRGFNTRLAFYGRMILALETSRAIMGAPASSELPPDPYGRVPFSHPALDSVDKLSTLQPHQFATPGKMARLATEVGLPGVVRWKPRMVNNLEGSGITVVMTSAIFAIIGAVSLHHGAEVASRVTRERIIKRLSA